MFNRATFYWNYRFHHLDFDPLYAKRRNSLFMCHHIETASVWGYHSRIPISHISAVAIFVQIDTKSCYTFLHWDVRSIPPDPKVIELTT